jgi:hypothetical protein
MGIGSWIRSKLGDHRAFPAAAAAELPDATKDAPVVMGDNPIHEENQDSLGRARAAKSFAAHLLALDVREGAVVGVLGPWGSGKTSFINLARRHLEAHGLPVIDFNPWMFSGTEHLVDAFFVELSAQLRLRASLADIGDNLQRYGEFFAGTGWIPIDAAVSAHANHGSFDEGRWLDVFSEIVRPLIRNMRDVRRYAAAVHGTVGALEGQIELVDVLALEAVRTFLPDTFRALHGAVEALTRSSDHPAVASDHPGDIALFPQRNAKPIVRFACRKKNYTAGVGKLDRALRRRGHPSDAHRGAQDRASRGGREPTRSGRQASERMATGHSQRRGLSS